MTTELKTDKATSKNVARKKLKVMRRSHHNHPLREKGRILKYGFSGFARNVWLSTAATAVMAITLIILFATVVVSIILTNTAEMMREKIDITVYFKPGTSENILADLSNVMSRDKNVKSVETSTSETEYKKFLAENSSSEEVLAVLDDKEMQKIMISKMQATMRVKVKDVNNLDSIKNLVESDELFYRYLDDEKSPTYDVNQAEIATITSWANIARTGGVILGVVFLTISILIIFSTVRIAIFSRREEIYMMKLVGADKRFIRGPFLVEAEICGTIAGVIAGLLCSLGFNFLAPKLSSYGIDIATISDIMNSNQIVFAYLLFITAGILIGFFSARLAISKYLNKA